MDFNLQRRYPVLSMIFWLHQLQIPCSEHNTSFHSKIIYSIWKGYAYSTEPPPLPFCPSVTKQVLLSPCGTFPDTVDVKTAKSPLLQTSFVYGLPVKLFHCEKLTSLYLLPLSKEQLLSIIPQTEED